MYLENLNGRLCRYSHYPRMWSSFRPARMVVFSLIRFPFPSRRSSRDDSSVAMAMTNGLGSPPIYDQHFQQQPEQRQFASDYFGSTIKARSNANNVNGAAQVVGQMREDSSDIGAAAQRLSSVLPAANNVRVVITSFLRMYVRPSMKRLQ